MGAMFNGILRSLYCLPCVWTLICGFLVVTIVGYFNNTWIPFAGSLPTVGPADGWISKTDKKLFFDISAFRIRAAAKVAFIGFLFYFAGEVILFIFLLHK